MLLEKKWKIILIASIVLLIIVFILWRIRAREEKIPQEKPLLEEERPTLLLSEETYTSLSEKTPESVIERSTLTPSPSLDKKDIFYFSKEDGYFYKYSLPLGKEEKISFRKFENVEDIQWSYQKDRAILSLIEEGQLKRYLFDLSTQKIQQLNPKLESVIFSPNRDKIAYLYYYTPLRANLTIADPSGSNWEKISSLDSLIGTPHLSWSPDGRKIAVYSPLLSPISEIVPEQTGIENIGDVYLVDLTTKKSKQITEGVSAGDVVWSEDGTKILYTLLENNDTSKPRLWLYDFKTQKKESLGFYGLSKYSIFKEENTIISILPRQEQNLIELAAYGIKEGIILEYNLETQEKKYLSKIESAEGLQPESLFLIDDKLFFTNAKDSRLYSLTLE